VERPLRVPVSEAGAKSGKGGVVVGGKVEGGALKPGTKVLVLPSKEIAVVKYVDESYY
jgi:elongation factor 1 alpha-like protein